MERIEAVCLLLVRRVVSFHLFGLSIKSGDELSHRLSDGLAKGANLHQIHAALARLAFADVALRLSQPLGNLLLRQPRRFTGCA